MGYLYISSIGYVVLEGGTPPCRSPVAKTLSLYMPDNVKIDPQTIVDLDLKVLVKIPERPWAWSASRAR